MLEFERGGRVVQLIEIGTSTEDACEEWRTYS